MSPFRSEATRKSGNQPDGRLLSRNLDLVIEQGEQMLVMQPVGLGGGAAQGAL
jgi:hypothetical protein